MKKLIILIITFLGSISLISQVKVQNFEKKVVSSIHKNNYETNNRLGGCAGIVFEDFNNGMPSDWQTVINTGICDYEIGTLLPTGSMLPSPTIFFNDHSCGVDADPSSVTLFSPIINTAGASTINLTFDVTFLEVGDQIFVVEVFDGANWQQIAIYDEDPAEVIQTVTFDVSAFANTNFQVRFTYDDLGNWGWYGGIDNFCLTIDGTANVLEENIKGFSFYPNPAKNSIKLNSIENIKNISIFNLLGKMVLNKPFDANNISLDISNLSTSIYSMRVKTNTQSGNYRIIKE